MGSALLGYSVKSVDEIFDSAKAIDTQDPSLKSANTMYHRLLSFLYRCIWQRYNIVADLTLRTNLVVP